MAAPNSDGPQENKGSGCEPAALGLVPSLGTRLSSGMLVVHRTQSQASRVGGRGSNDASSSVTHYAVIGGAE